MRKRIILYITGSRADYGLMKSLLKRILSSHALKLKIIVTGMHLMKEFGYTVKEVLKDGYDVKIINATYKNDDKESMVIFLGLFLQKLIEYIKTIKIDIILLLGDRSEMLAGAIAGAYLSIPIAHIHGGEISSTVDDTIRHTISKIANIHFPASKQSAKYLKYIGENSKNIYITGAPGLDIIYQNKDKINPDIIKKYNIDLNNPLIIVVQHPVTLEYEAAAMQIQITLDAIKELKYPTIVIYPNADASGKQMIKIIQRYSKLPFIKIFKNIEHNDFIELMKISDAIVGNSSSALIEAPSLSLPAINIGTRQKGRLKTRNVINVTYNKNEIKNAINKALFDKRFLYTLKRIKNPYGNGNAGKKIEYFLSNIKLNKKDLQKNVEV